MLVAPTSAAIVPPVAVSKAPPQPEYFIKKILDQATGQERIQRQYLKGKLLGKGAFAKCYEATDPDTRVVYAAKVIAKASLQKTSARQKLLTEIKLHKQSKHEHVVKFLDCFEDDVNVYIILELCPNMSMMEFMKRKTRLTESEARPFMAQIVSAVKYLHSHGIIHRDLKLGNLFLTSTMAIKIGDFGLATKLAHEGERKKTLCGTPNYIAPEILDKTVGHSFEVDIWAIGVILFTLLTGKPPFETTDVKAVYERIKANQYSFPPHIEISEDAKDLIRRMLSKVPEHRPKLDEILLHPWFARDPTFRPRPLQDATSATNIAHGSAASPSKSRTLSIAPTPLSHPSLASYNKENDSAQVNAQLSRLTVGPRPAAPVPSSSASSAFPAPSMPVASHHTHKREVPLSRHSTRPEPELPSIRKWIVHWIDYTDKYGLAFLLSDRSVGVYFNDNTRIVCDTSGRRATYLEGSSVQSFWVDAFPPALQKKVTLLDYFRNSLLGASGVAAEPPSDPSRDEVVYLKKWVKTKQAVLFILSTLHRGEGDGLIQVNFAEDNARVLLHNGGTQLTYIDQYGDVRSQVLDETSPNSVTDEKLRQRLSYINQILFHLLNPSAHARSS